MRVETVTLGGLQCRLVNGNVAPPPQPPRMPRPAPAEMACPEAAKMSGATRLAVVLCHGYGAPGDDLVSLAPEVFHAVPSLESRLCFVFPEGPLALSPLGPWDSRAWWPLDERILDAAIANGTPIERVRAIPAELPDLRASLRRLLRDLDDREGIPLSRVVLGGFSQGAMLTTDLALHLPVSPAGLCVLSGSLMDAEEWARLAAARRGMPALITHGRQDPLLSFGAAERLRRLLADAGVMVEFVPFDGPHTIAPEGFAALAAFLQARAAAGAAPAP